MKYFNSFVFCLIIALALVLPVLAVDETTAEPVPTLYADIVQEVDGEVQDEATAVVVEPILVEGSDTITAESEPIIIEGLDSLVDVELNIPEEVPTNWGLFWRGVRERVTVALTFDPVEKAEKQLKFAEERMIIAEKMIQNTTDEKLQERAQKMIEKAQSFMQQVEAKKEKWLENKDGRVEKLLQNIATHQVRKEDILDRIEIKIPEEKMEKWQEMRGETIEDSRRLMNAISNENIPDKIKEHLNNIKVRIEEHAQEVKQFNEQKKGLIESVKDGFEGAQAELKQLREQRQEILQERKDVYEEKKDELKTAAQAGDEQAQKQLKVMGVTQMIKKEIVENKLEKQQENLAERIDNLEESVSAGDPQAQKKLEQVKEAEERVKNRIENRIENKLENLEVNKPMPKVETFDGQDGGQNN